MTAGDETSRIVRELADREAISRLLHEYCLRFDANEPEAVAALFTADASVDYGPEFPTVRGSRAIEEAIAAGLERTFAATSHHLSNVVITLEPPDAARSVTYLYAWHRYVDGSPDGELWGRYHHRFLRTEDGWRISELVLQAAGTRSFHRSAMHPIGRRPSRASTHDRPA